MGLLLLEVLLPAAFIFVLAVWLLMCVRLLITIAALEVLVEVYHVGQLPGLVKLEHLVFQTRQLLLPFLELGITR